MTDKRYDYWLNRLPGIGVQKRSILLADGRSAKDIFEMREEELLEIPVSDETGCKADHGGSKYL